MNSLYLTDFQVQNFRCFGSVTMNFKPEPGVIILVGPNGLGKTSWFEAVEIALTGRVARWQDVQQRVKVKVLAVRQNEERASVRLAFNNQPLETSPACWDSDGRVPLSVEGLLCDNAHSWGLTSENLDGFLRATHFFPQSASMRTLHKPPEDRWEQILRHVSGFDQLARLSENLGQGTLRALTDLANSREMRRLSKQQELEVWQSRLSKLREMERSRKQQGEVLSPRDAVIHLVGALGEPQPDVRQNNIADAAGLLAVIDRKLGELSEEQSTLDAGMAQLSNLRGASSEWIGVNEEIRQISASLEEYNFILISITNEIERASAWLATVESEYSSLLAERDRSRLLLSEVDEILAIYHQEETAASQLAAAERASADARARLLYAESRLTDIKSASENFRHWEASMQALTEHQMALKAAISQRKTLRSLESSLSKVDTDKRDLELEAGRAASLLSELSFTLRSETVLWEKAVSDLDVVRANTESLQEALSKILEHLEPMTHDCPVCQANYSSDGELMRRAGEAISRLSPRLAQAGEELRSREAERKKAAESLTSTQLRYDFLREKLASVVVRRRGLQEEFDAVRTSLTFPHLGDDHEPLVKELSVLAEQERALQEANAPFANLRPSIAEQLRESLVLTDQARHHVQETSEFEGQAKNSLDGLVLRRTALESRLDDDLPAQPLARRETLLPRLTRQEEGVASSHRKLVSARAALETKRIEARERASEKEREVARFEERKSSLKRLEGRWTGAGLAGKPSALSFDAEEQRLQERKTSLNLNRHEIRRIQMRLSAWVADSEIHSERLTMGEIAGGFDDHALDDHARRISRSIDDSVKSRIQAETASTIAKQFSSSSQMKKSSLYRTLQSDLEVSLVQLLPLLIKDPNFHDIIASIETSKRSTSFSPRSANGVQVEAFASEGQLSGLGFSVQLAMALAFPWSRWRGLLLDDPLQYSDIVHTSNLVEVLRLLARQQGFQIFISTHERSLADYVFRKFRNAGLSAERIVFRDAPDGVGGIPTLQQR